MSFGCICVKSNPGGAIMTFLSQFSLVNHKGCSTVP